jgi:hypothetical protein
MLSAAGAFMTLKTLLGYLMGQESAIREIASNRRSLLIGFLFCLSAALARHYDGKYLVREPWFLLAPAGASILTSAILFLCVYIATSLKARKLLPGFVTCYLSFLGLYWMTAPLAWLYGIPYERFLSEVGAAQANIWTLELVSIWRVLLISRAVAVLTPSSLFSALTKIAVPAIGVGFVALSYARMPLINWMGGVRLPPSVQPVAGAYMFAIFYGFFALIIGGLIWLGSLFVASPDGTLEGFRVVQAGPAGRGPSILALLVIFGFAAALPITQREQKLRYDVEKDLKNNRVKEALDVLASHQRSEFPPQWTPPPWPEYGDGDRNPSLVQIVKALEIRIDVPEWVRSTYRDKVKLYLEQRTSNPLQKADELQLMEFSGENARRQDPH